MNKHILGFDTWLEETDKLAQVEKSKVEEFEAEPVGVCGQDGSGVAPGTKDFIRLHKIQKQMRSKPTEDDAVFKADNVEKSKTAVNDRTQK